MSHGCQSQVSVSLVSPPRATHHSTCRLRVDASEPRSSTCSPREGVPARWGSCCAVCAALCLARYSPVVSVAVARRRWRRGNPILFLTSGLTCPSHRGTPDPGHGPSASLSQQEAQILHLLICLSPSLVSSLSQEKGPLLSTPTASQDNRGLINS